MAHTCNSVCFLRECKAFLQHCDTLYLLHCIVSNAYSLCVAWHGLWTTGEPLKQLTRRSKRQNKRGFILSNLSCLLNTGLQANRSLLFASMTVHIRLTAKLILSSLPWLSIGPFPLDGFLFFLVKLFLLRFSSHLTPAIGTLAWFLACHDYRLLFHW